MALMQLIAYGAQDLHLSGQVQITRREITLDEIIEEMDVKIIYRVVVLKHDYDDQEIFNLFHVDDDDIQDEKDVP